MFRAAKDKIRQKKEVKKLTKVLIHIYHKYFLLCRNNFVKFGKMYIPGTTTANKD